MKIEVSKQDIIWSHLSTIANLLSNFVILTFVLKYLDDLTIGLYYIFTSLRAITILFDFGFVASFSRNIAYCWSGSTVLKKEGANAVNANANVDYALMKRVLFTSKTVYAVLSSVVLFLGLTLGTAYVFQISKVISGNKHIIAWLVYAVAIFINLYYGYYTAYLRGVGAIQEVGKIITASSVFLVIASAVILIEGGGLLGLSAVYFTYSLLFRYGCKKVFYGYKNIGRNLSEVQEDNTIRSTYPLFKVIWFNSWREGMISLSSFLLNQAGTVICSAFFTLYETGVYSLAMQLANGIAMISSTLYTAYEPTLQSAFVQQDVEKQKRSLSVVVVSYIVLFVLGMCLLFLIVRPVIAWLRPSYFLPTSLLLLVGVYQFIINFRNCYTTYFSSTNRLFYMRSFVFSAFLCVILSILFAKFTNFGTWGFVLAQIASQAVFNMWYWTWKAHQELNLKISDMISYSLDMYRKFLKQN